MAIYKKRGHSFTKTFFIPNKEKNKALFVFQISIGINADRLECFKQTANWVFIGAGINIKKGHMIPGLHLKWNVKHYE